MALSFHPAVTLDCPEVRHLTSSSAKCQGLKHSNIVVLRPTASRNASSITRHLSIVYSLLVIYGLALPALFWLTRSELRREIRDECLSVNTWNALRATGHRDIPATQPYVTISQPSLSPVEKIRLSKSLRETKGVAARPRRSAMTESSVDDSRDGHVNMRESNSFDASSLGKFINGSLVIRRTGDTEFRDFDRDEIAEDLLEKEREARLRSRRSGSSRSKLLHTEGRATKINGRKRNSVEPVTPIPRRQKNAAKRSSKRVLPFQNEIPRLNRVIHMHARLNIERQHVSPSLMSFNNTDTVYRLWRKADWVPIESNETFSLNENDGVVFIKQPGLYLVYAQMVYHDLTGRWSFGVYVNGQQRVKCLVSEQLRKADHLHLTNHGVYQPCYTAVPIFVAGNAMVNIRCMYGTRTILTQPEFTFWGVVKLS